MKREELPKDCFIVYQGMGFFFDSPQMGFAYIFFPFCALQSRDSFPTSPANMT